MIFSSKNINSQLESLSAEVDSVIDQLKETLAQNQLSSREDHQELSRNIEFRQKQSLEVLANINDNIEHQKKSLEECKKSISDQMECFECKESKVLSYLDTICQNIQNLNLSLNYKELLMQFDALQKQISLQNKVYDSLKTQFDQYQLKIDSLLEQNTINFSRIILKENILDSQIQEISRNIFKNTPYSQVETKRFKKNFTWYLRRDAYDNVSNYVRGGYIGSSPDWDVIEEAVWSLLPEKGVFLDIGANIGAFCLPAASMGLKGYAIEASEINIGALKESIIHNSFDITLLHKAVWESTGPVQFIQKGPQGFVKDFIHKQENYEIVEAICLDDYKKIPELSSIQKVDFIKIDIEGSEPAALRGMKNFLQEMDYPVVMVEANIWNLFCMRHTPKDLLTELQLLGYKPYAPYKGGLFEYDPKTFPKSPCTDYLLIKKAPDHLKSRIIGNPKHNPEEDLYFARQQLENFRNWVNDYGINPNEVLPHIALYYLANFYAHIKDDPIVNQYKNEIAAKLIPLDNPIFNQMIHYES